MAKEVDSIEGRKAATKEIIDILRTVMAVKGERYGDLLRLVFGLANYQQAINMLLDSDPSTCHFKESIIVLHKAHEATIQDLTTVLIKAYIGPFDGSDADYDKEVRKVIDELAADLKTLDKKQQEYSASVFPSYRPEL